MLNNIFKNKKMMDVILNKSQPLLSGMLGALIILSIMEWAIPKPKTVATINITQLTQDFIQKEKDQSISQEKLKQETIAFGKQLEKNIKGFAEKNHLILLPREAVMAGSRDYTLLIAKAMEQSRSRDENAI